jgi:hypothetical protein
MQDGRQGCLQRAAVLLLAVAWCLTAGFESSEVVGPDDGVVKPRVFKMGLLTPWHLGYEFSGYTSASAVSIAIDKVHSDPKLNANGRIRLR